MTRATKGYSRVDLEEKNVHGWLVRIKRGAIRKSKFFSDSTNGGKRNSLSKAKQLYLTWTSQLPPPKSISDQMTSRNASGVVGVHFASDTDARYPKCKYESYVASWTSQDGRRINVRFSCNKHGKKAAFELACLARKHKLSDRDQVLSIFNRRRGKSMKPRKIANG